MSDSPRKLVVLDNPNTRSSIPTANPLTRRRLLETALAAALALPLLPACPGPGDTDGGVPNSGPPEPDGGVDGGDGDPCAPSSCTVDENTVILPLAEHPELVPVFGWSVYFNTRYADPVCQNDAFLVIQVAKGQYLAMSASCTHACCTVSLATNNSEFQCPCHNSTYSLQGVATSGPALATGNLPTLPVCFDGCAVYVQLP